MGTATGTREFHVLSLLARWLAERLRPWLRRKNPIPLILPCPNCGRLHVDEGEWATTRVHRTHLCLFCAVTWRPCARPTVGVAGQPGVPTELVVAAWRKAKASGIARAARGPRRSWSGRMKLFTPFVDNSAKNSRKNSP